MSALFLHRAALTLSPYYTPHSYALFHYEFIFFSPLENIHNMILRFESSDSKVQPMDIKLTCTSLLSVGVYNTSHLIPLPVKGKKSVPGVKMLNDKTMVSILRPSSKKSGPGPGPVSSSVSRQQTVPLQKMSSKQDEWEWEGGGFHLRMEFNSTSNRWEIAKCVYSR
jgi:hypothetical protein